MQTCISFLMSPRSSSFSWIGLAIWVASGSFSFWTCVSCAPLVFLRVKILSAVLGIAEA
jgi:hypothetical protein